MQFFIIHTVLAQYKIEDFYVKTLTQREINLSLQLGKKQDVLRRCQRFYYYRSALVSLIPQGRTNQLQKKKHISNDKKTDSVHPIQHSKAEE